MRYFRIITSAFLIFFSMSIVAQEDLLTQVDLSWKYKPNPEGRWSYKFGSGYRSTFFTAGKFDYNTGFLQLSVAPSFSINSNQSVSLEVRYRIKELFDSQLTDEKRIIQQYSHSHTLNKVKLKGRLRVEQRFRDRFNLRNRYRIGVSFAINKNSNPLKEWIFTSETETLWSITPHKSTTFDQRFTVVLEKPISEKIVLKLKPQYRYLDYTHDARDVWRVYGILSISL